MGLSDHGPKTLVIVDEIAADEQALKSLTDDVCATFGTYGLSLPSIPHHHLGNYVPCQVLIKTFAEPDGRRRGRIQFIRPSGVLGYDHEWVS